jgi:1-acyl-sn-glycerol-3-phosphate acyltransferase
MSPIIDDRQAPLSDKLIATGLWAAGLTYLATAMPLVTWTTRVVPSHKVDWLTRIYLRGQIMLTGCRWQSEVDPGVDPDTVYMFAQNHINIFDYATMYNATPHYKQGVNLKKHFKIPFYGPFMQHRGTLAVVRGDRTAGKELLRRSREEVAAGRSLLVFPEGTRTRDGRVQTFHDGMFRIAHRLQIPIVPTAVTGMTEVLNTDSWIMRPFQDVTVHVLAPIPTRGVPATEIPDIARLVQQRISEKVDAYYAKLESTP